MHILPLLAIAIASLFITFILFRYLDSYAHGDGQALNGTVKYGGALGGFVVVFGLLFGGYAWLFPPASEGTSKQEPKSVEETPVERTDVVLAGMWRLHFIDEISGRDRFLFPEGDVCVRQSPGSTFFSISGELNKEGENGFLTFHSEDGKIGVGRAMFRYTLGGADGVKGNAEMVLTNDQPSRLLIDFLDDDSSNSGQFILTKEAQSCSSQPRAS